MSASFVVVPQWQSSGSSRAMRLVDGAAAIRGDLPATATQEIAVPLESGDSLGTGVHRLSAIAAVRDGLVTLLRDAASPVIVIGGDCGVEVGAVSHLLDSDGSDVAVVWFDAHPDLNTPGSSTSHAFTGMVARTLLGDGPPQLVPETVLAPSRLILAGVRSFDAEEDRVIAERDIRCLGPNDVDSASVIAAVEATGASRVYVHIDLDVLDPEDIAGIGYPQPFGVRAAVLIQSIKDLVARFPLAGAGITEFAPASADDAADDMSTILRIIAALRS